MIELRPPRFVQFVRKRRATVYGWLSVLIGLGVWEVAGRLRPNNMRLFLVPFSDVVTAIWKMAHQDLFANLKVSGLEFVIGFGLAMTVGIVVGMLMGALDGVRYALDPWVMGLFSTPTVAVAPIFILIFGLDIASKVAMVFLLAVLPIIISTTAGVRRTPRELVEVAQAFGCSRLLVFTKVVAPAALPFVVTGLRQGIGRGLVGVVIGELLGARAGIGFMIQQAYQMFEAASVYGGVLLLAGTGIITSVVIQAVERWMAPWRDTSLNL